MLLLPDREDYRMERRFGNSKNFRKSFLLSKDL